MHIWSRSALNEGIEFGGRETMREVEARGGRRCIREVFERLDDKRILTLRALS